MIYLISGNGQGAGKTTLAQRLVSPSALYSIATELRKDLKRLYPAYDWDNKTQAYKDGTSVIECGGVTVRRTMVQYGQDKCREDPCYWVKKLAARLMDSVGVSVVAIDDVRKTCELEYLRECFPSIIHFHVKFSGAVAEPHYDGDALERVADYVCIRGDSN